MSTIKTKLQNATKTVVRKACKTLCVFASGAALLGGTYFYGQFTAIEEERAEAYGQFGAEVHIVAQLIVGEIGAHPEEWEDLFSAFIGRVESPLFPNTIEGVAKQLRPGSERAQIDAMNDRKMELMTTKQGLAAIAFAQEHLRSYYAGTFVPTIEAHSWATAKAAKDHAYYEGLRLVAVRGGHNYYTGTWCDKTKELCKSLRPKPRPAHLGQDVATRVAAEVAANLN